MEEALQQYLEKHFYGGAFTQKRRNRCHTQYALKSVTTSTAFQDNRFYFKENSICKKFLIKSAVNITG